MEIPDDIVWEIASKMDNVDASMLKMTCKRLQRIVVETHPHLPIPKPSYHEGSGKYQTELLELQALGDIVDVDDKDDRKAHWATTCIVGNGLLGLQDNALIRNLKNYKNFNKEYKAMFQQIKRKLKEWEHPRYKKALKALSRHRFWRRDPTPEEEEEHGLAVMDAVIMVGIERLRLLPLLPPEWRD